MRNRGFCSAWDVLVQLGCCDDSFSISHAENMTHADFLSLFLDGHEHLTVEEKVMNQFKLNRNAPELERLRWSGFFSDDPIGIATGTPAKILEHILSKKWTLTSGDKDMIIMIHRFIAEINGVRKMIQSSLAVVGDDEIHTAMAKTVGLPLGMAANLLMQGKVKARGVCIPTSSEFYEPILDELEKYGIRMIDTENMS